MSSTEYDRQLMTNRKLLRQEELILEVTEALVEQLIATDTKQGVLAERLGKSKGYVSQLMGGGNNLTLRTIADVADALNVKPRLVLTPRDEAFTLTDWKPRRVGRVLPLFSNRCLEHENENRSSDECMGAMAL
jgi:transcriptional regulator with XRE-family HTH domain